MNQNQANEYIRRINTVCDYIDQNLGDEMTLQTLARVAEFFEYHFHRIFSAMTGETLFCFIQRLRLERAAAQLCMVQRVPSVTEIAMGLGFSSTAVFSRSFQSICMTKNTRFPVVISPYHRPQSLTSCTLAHIMS